MTAFHTIAVPHEDILAGRLTLDVFAADLWEVHKGRAPDEYRDPARFFHKTYQTEGLRNLLAVVEKRLRGARWPWACWSAAWPVTPAAPSTCC